MTYRDAVRLLPWIRHLCRRPSQIESDANYLVAIYVRPDLVFCRKRILGRFLFPFLVAFDANRDAVDEQNSVCSAQDAFVHDSARIARNPKTLNSVSAVQGIPLAGRKSTISTVERN